jgi:PEP-CTERM motif
MKKTIINSTLCAMTLPLLIASAAHAQEASPGSFYTPAYRGQTGTESAFWNDASAAADSGFTNATGINNATYVAPGGSTLANASVTQTTPGAFIIPGQDGTGNSGDIYSFSSINTFVLNYTVSSPANFPNGVGNVIFQTETLGSELDYSSVVLNYTLAGGAQETLSATANELSNGGSAQGGSDVLTEWEWNLPAADDVTSFSIDFNGSGTSVGLERTMLDVAPFDVAPVPEPGSLALFGMAGMGLLIWMRRSHRQSSN